MTLLEGMSREAQLRWVRWWAYGCILEADGSWRVDAGLAGGRTAMESLAPHQHACLRARWSLPESLPESPSEALWALIALTPDQRVWALELIASVCRAPEHPLPPAPSQWCRRLAKALRPGLWLPENLSFTARRQSDALCLLRHCLSAAAWPRVRLLFPRSWSVGVEETPAAALPESRVNALCDAAIWKARLSAAPDGDDVGVFVRHRREA
ncbi:serine kinase [Lonsdalea quercina]|uniref:serine kinase n=1 Tax=Lonsdalea quercina TaxID=71657 RepID=UPI0039756609